MPAMYRLGQIERQAAISEGVAHKHGPGESQEDHHHRALEIEKIGERVLIAAENLQRLSHRADQAFGIERDVADLDRRLRNLRDRPIEEIAAKEEHQEEKKRRGVE